MSKAKRDKVESAVTAKEIEAEMLADAGVDPNSGDVLPEGFSRIGGKITVARKVGKGEDAESVDVPICTDFRVTGRMRDELGSGWGREIEFTSEDRMVKRVFIPDGAVAGDAAKVREALADAGLWISTGKADREAFSRLLNLYSTSRLITSFSKPGRHQDGDDLVFVCPSGAVIRAKHATASKEEGAQPSVEYRLRDGAGARDRRVVGTLEAWQGGAAAIFNDPDLPHMALGIMSGCAGTVLAFADEPSCGLHFGGSSSRGKTTAQVYGASCWGNPAPDKGILVTARGTDNAVEFKFVIGNHTSLHIDEAKNGNPKMVAGLAFQFASEQGKLRLSSDVKERRTLTWRSFLTLSSEKPLRSITEQNNESLLAGATVRLPSIDVSSLAAIDPRVAKAIKDVAMNNFGHVGPLFVAALLERGYDTDGGALRDRIDAHQADLVDGSPHPIRNRAARVLAVLWTVGDVMVEADLLGPKVSASAVEKAIRWGWTSYLSTPDARSLDPGKDGADTLLLWLQSNPGRVREIGDRDGYQEVVAWFDETTVYLPRAHFSKLNLPTGETAILEELAQRGMLEMSGKNRGHSHLPGVGKQPHYRIKFKIGRAARVEDDEKVPTLEEAFPTPVRH